MLWEKRNETWKWNDDGEVVSRVWFKWWNILYSMVQVRWVAKVELWESRRFSRPWAWDADEHPQRWRSHLESGRCVASTKCCTPWFTIHLYPVWLSFSSTSSCLIELSKHGFCVLLDETVSSGWASQVLCQSDYISYRKQPIFWHSACLLSPQVFLLPLCQAGTPALFLLMPQPGISVISETLSRSSPYSSALDAPHPLSNLTPSLNSFL